MFAGRVSTSFVVEIPCAGKPTRRRTSVITARADRADRADRASRMPDVLDALLDAIAAAEKTCAAGPSARCAAAWDLVDDITTGMHRVRERDFPRGDALDLFCDVNPGAVECKVYDV